MIEYVIVREGGFIFGKNIRQGGNMNLDKKSIKQLRQLILFTIVILIALWNYAIIFEWIGFAFGIIFPFLLGGAIAFVLNVPMNFLEEKIFRNKYLKDKKIAKRIARPVCLVLTIAIVIGVVVLVMFGCYSGTDQDGYITGDDDSGIRAGRTAFPRRSLHEQHRNK